MALMRGEGVAVFSLEMTKDSIVRRLISSIGNINAQRFRSGRLDRDELQRAAKAAAQIKGLPLFINDIRARTMPAMTSALRKLNARHPIRLKYIRSRCGGRARNSMKKSIQRARRRASNLAV
jgi:replicative DNA helicase